MVDSGLQPYFSLISFNLKPMDAPPPGTSKFLLCSKTNSIAPEIVQTMFHETVIGDGRYISDIEAHP